MSIYRTLCVLVSWKINFKICSLILSKDFLQSIILIFSVSPFSPGHSIPRDDPCFWHRAFKKLLIWSAQLNVGRRVWSAVWQNLVWMRNWLYLTTKQCQNAQTSVCPQKFEKQFSPKNGSQRSLKFSKTLSVLQSTDFPKVHQRRFNFKTSGICPTSGWILNIGYHVGLAVTSDNGRCR